MASAYCETRELMAQRERWIVIGFSLMTVNRIAGLVPPANCRFLINAVIGKRNEGMLLPLAPAALAVMVIRAVGDSCSPRCSPSPRSRP